MGSWDRRPGPHSTQRKRRLDDLNGVLSHEGLGRRSSGSTARDAVEHWMARGLVCVGRFDLLGHGGPRDRRPRRSRGSRRRQSSGRGHPLRSGCVKQGHQWCGHPRRKIALLNRGPRRTAVRPPRTMPYSRSIHRARKRNVVIMAWRLWGPKRCQARPRERTQKLGAGSCPGQARILLWSDLHAEMRPTR